MTDSTNWLVLNDFRNQLGLSTKAVGTIFGGMAHIEAIVKIITENPEHVFEYAPDTVERFLRGEFIGVAEEIEDQFHWAAGDGYILPGILFESESLIQIQNYKLTDGGVWIAKLIKNEAPSCSYEEIPCEWGDFWKAFAFPEDRLWDSATLNHPFSKMKMDASNSCTTCMYKGCISIALSKLERLNPWKMPDTFPGCVSYKSMTEAK